MKGISPASLDCHDIANNKRIKKAWSKRVCPSLVNGKLYPRTMMTQREEGEREIDNKKDLMS